MKTINRLGRVAFAGATLAVGTVSVAQDRTVLLEEVVVTAERRQESVLEVPLSISAFSSEVRERVGIYSIQDMANFAPGVSYNTSLDRPSIRGIARQSNSFSLDSPVANYYDGVYTTSVQDAQRRPLFIERTEILRGPQGALSGRGSIGGAINTISKRPQDTFGAELSLTGATYDRVIIDATATGPLTDWLRARVNLGLTRQEKGYFENVANPQTEGDQPNNREIADFLFEVDLSESVDWFVKLAFADYDETNRTLASTAPYVSGVQNNPTAYGPSTADLTPLSQWGFFPASQGQVLSGFRQNPVLVTGDLRKYATNFRSNQQLDDHHNYTSHLTWHAPSVDVKWIGAHQNYKYTQWTDPLDGDILSMRLPAPFAPPGTPGRTVSPDARNLYQEEREWYSNELTFTSTNESSLQWILGLYESDEEYEQQPQTRIYPGYTELNQPWGTIDRLLAMVGAPFNAANFARPVAANPVAGRAQFGHLDGETISRAAFGQISYELTDQWKFTVGLRYNEDKKEVTESTRYIANGLGDSLGGLLAGGGSALIGLPGATGPISVDVTPLPPAAGTALPKGVARDRGIDPVTGYRVRDLKGKWDALTGSAGVDFTPTDDTLVYFRFAKGYRPGGFNAGFISDVPQADKESVDSYEIGYKATLADRLQISTSAFYYDYQDMQIELNSLGRCTNPADLSSCTTLNIFVNMETAESMGLETEINWLATDQLNLLLTYGYLDASIKEAGSAQGFINPIDSGAVLPSARRLRAVGQVDAGYTFLPIYTQDLSGNQLANSPKHRAAFNASYTVPFSAGNLVLSGSYVWRDRQFSDAFETKAGEVPSFSTVGARLIWTDAEDRYSIMFYGTNLTDEDVSDGVVLTRQRTGLATAAAPSAFGQAYYKSLNLAPPREFGVEVQMRFGKN